MKYYKNIAHGIQIPDHIRSDALISKDQEHRYWLSRIWDESKPIITFIGLNPSRADHVYNDQTIKKCIKFAQRFADEDCTFEQQLAGTHKKYGGMYFLNLYSFRTPYPEKLIEAIKVGDAFKEETDFNLAWKIKESKTVVCAWGSWMFTEDRSQWVLRKHILGQGISPRCFGINKDKSPKHPLYLKDSAQLTPYIFGIKKP